MLGPMRRQTLSILLLASLLAFPTGCDDPPANADTADSSGSPDTTLADGRVPDTAKDTAKDSPSDISKEGRSYYRIVIDTEFEEPITVERDITDSKNNFAFGSTHIAPAISFAVSENLVFPATLSINFNFGIVLGSNTYPVQCDQAGDYQFGGAPPEIDITKGIRYVSSVPGSTGAIKITSWTRTTGEVFKGTFSGRIRQLTEKAEKRWADIEGEFQFIMPKPAQGQSR